MKTLAAGVRCCRRPRVGGVLLPLLPLVLLAFITGCSNDDENDLAAREDLRSEFGLKSLAQVPYPPDNQPDADRVELGRQLFFDPLLSGRQDVSCGTCHHPAFAWADGRSRSIGVSGEVPGVGTSGVGPDRILTEPNIFFETPRNSPTCMNSGCSSQPFGSPDAHGLQFWDGRADGLEDQSKLPITSFDEMSGGVYAASDAMNRVLEKLRGVPGYEPLFRKAFPTEAAEMDLFPERHVIRQGTYARALAAYQRELVFLSSPYDEYVSGDDWALTEKQFEGMKLFFRKANCGSCHAGPMLATYEFAVTGVPQAGPGRDPRGGDPQDYGRYEHTEEELDRYAFRVPSLRNIELTAPYFRTGEYATLREVVRFYNKGGNEANLPDWRIDPRLAPLDLTDEEIDQLVAFLKALTDTSVDSPIVDLTVPLAVPSGLSPPEPLAPFSRVP